MRGKIYFTNYTLCSGEGPEFHSKPLLRVVAVDCVKADIVKHRLLCGGAEDEVVGEEDLFDQDGVGRRFLWGCVAVERKHGEGLNHEAVEKNKKKRGPHFVHFAVHESYTFSVTLAATNMGQYHSSLGSMAWAIVIFIEPDKPSWYLLLL